MALNGFNELTAPLLLSQWEKGQGMRAARVSGLSAISRQEAR
jgi:hypothetical protein